MKLINRHSMTCLALAVTSAAAMAVDSANYRYTPLPTSSHGFALGVAFSITNNGSVLYEAANGNNVGYAIVDGHGNTTFTPLGAMTGAQSMNNDHWFVGNGPTGAFYNRPSDGQHPFFLHQDKVFLWGINDHEHFCGADGNHGFLYLDHTKPVNFVDFPGASETMCRGLSNNDSLCGSFWNGATHGWYRDSSWHCVDFPGACVSVCSSINIWSAVLGYYEPGKKGKESRGGFICRYGDCDDITLPAPPDKVRDFDSCSKKNEDFQLSDYWVLPMGINDAGVFIVARIGHYCNSHTGTKLDRYVSYVATPCSTNP